MPTNRKNQKPDVVNNWVRTLYTTDKLSMNKIAEIIGVDPRSIRQILVDMCIDIEPKETRIRMSKIQVEELKDISVKINLYKKSNKQIQNGESLDHYSKYLSHKLTKTQIRFDVSMVWLSQFSNTEKLQFLNRCIVRTERFPVDTVWYVSYMEKFYYDKEFNRLYDQWVDNGKHKDLRPTIDHIVPQSKGGGHELENLRFVTWFENKCKSGMDLNEWEFIKSNIGTFISLKNTNSV